MTSSKFKVVLLQYPIHSDFEKNFTQIKSLLERAVKKKPSLVVMPEMWLGSPPSKEEVASWVENYKKGLVYISQWCKRHACWAYFSQLEGASKRHFNTAYLIGSKGQVASVYRKIHLFRLGGECDIYSSGSKTVVTSTPWGFWGSAVCFDIRFPEFIRHLTHKKTQLLLVCAQWPHKREAHWLTLLRARAIENQIFVIGSNRLGVKKGEVYTGASVVYDPWGKELLRLNRHQRLGVATLDLQELHSIRKNYPFLSERKNIF